MQIPYFFAENIPFSGKLFLAEDSSKHIAQVLRMSDGEVIHLTNGKGDLFTAKIVTANKKSTEVDIFERKTTSVHPKKVAIGISLVKNNSRFEWFLEKVIEIGISAVIPLICHRTEKQYFKIGRMRSISISAMLQSRQTLLPMVHEPANFLEVIENSYDRKFIAHCNAVTQTLKDTDSAFESAIILIGPEGDFTDAEISAALDHNFQPVSLGGTRLRTETAGIVAAVLLKNK